MSVRLYEGCLLCVLTVVAFVRAAVELPKFSQLRLLYPGYHLHGGKYRDRELFPLIGGMAEHRHLHNTAALRMSWTLNRYGGRHSIGTAPINMTEQGRDSFTGKDKVEYIFSNTAFGPYLASKYGSPVVVKPDKHDHTRTMNPFHRKQGIVRLVSYHKHAGGHIALWDCDHFYQSRDWTTQSHIISVEFWESPDSYCAPDITGTQPTPQLQRYIYIPSNAPAQLQVVARHNLPATDRRPGGRRQHRLGAGGKTRRHRHMRYPKEKIWLQ